MDQQAQEDQRESLKDHFGLASDLKAISNIETFILLFYFILTHFMDVLILLYGSSFFKCWLGTLKIASGLSLSRYLNRPVHE